MLKFSEATKKKTKKTPTIINPQLKDCYESETVAEAKVDKGRSDYGKASIRNYRRKGPGHGEPGMFDSEGKRGKTIELRRKEHKDRRGVKGAKVPAYKREDVEVAEAKVDKMVPDHKRSGKRLERYGNPHGSLALGGGIQRDRRADHAERRGKKTKGLKEAMSSYDRNRKAAAKRAAARNAARAAGKTGVVPGVGYVTPHRERETYRDEAGVERHKSGAKMPSKKKVNEAHNSCGKGQYWCNKDEKCKPIPEGHHVMPDGKLMKGKKHEETEVYWSSKALDQLEDLKEKKKNCGCGKDPCITYGSVTSKKKDAPINPETGVQTEAKNPYGKRAVIKMLIKSMAERERAKAGVTKEGTSYGIFRGDGKPKGAMAAFAKKDKKKKKDAIPTVGTPSPVSEAKTAAWQRKEGKNKEGGLNEKGRKSYERENPGSDLKAPQPEGGPRKNSFCARMSGVKGPMKDEKGRPTRKALALKKWKCGKSEDWKPFGKFIIDSVQSKESFYGSQEKVSNESNKEVEQTETLTAEATRYAKETGTHVKGGTKKPTSPKTKDAALDFIKNKYKGQIMRSGSNQQKKVKGAKSTVGTNKYKNAADAKKQTASDAKKRGFKSTQNYVDTMARYGGKKNYDKGRGLGT